MVGSDDEGGDVDFGGLELDGEGVEVDGGRVEFGWSSRDSVVSDERVGEDKDLGGVGRIGEGFGVSDHP